MGLGGREEFGETMVEDYQSASKRFWQTIQHLRKRKQFFTNTVYIGDGELLALTWDVIGWWEEYSENLLNLTDTHTVEKAGMRDAGNCNH